MIDRLVKTIACRYEVQSEGKMEGLAPLAHILLGRWNGPGETINVIEPWIFETRVTVLKSELVFVEITYFINSGVFLGVQKGAQNRHI